MGILGNPPNFVGILFFPVMFVHQFYATTEGETSHPGQNFLPHHGGLSPPRWMKEGTSFDACGRLVHTGKGSFRDSPICCLVLFRLKAKDPLIVLMIS